MKKSIIYLLLVFFTFTWQAKSQSTTTCGNFRVDLIDSDGDGWNGGSLAIYINGNAYLVSITLNSGSGPESFDIPVNQNDILSFVYTPGNWSNENQYIIYDTNGIEVANEGAGNNVPGNIGDPNIPSGLQACPSCPPPSNLFTANITDTQADLYWTENGTATAWNIEYGPTGFTQGQGTIIPVTNNSYTLTGLLPSHTGYDFYVQADCGGGDLSFWTGPETFQTDCGTITTFPYNYGFEDMTENNNGNWSESCWTMTSQSNYNFIWTPGSNNAQYGYPPDNAHSGSMYAYTIPGGYTGDTAEITSPVFDLSGLSHPKLSFYYFMLGPTPGTLSVDTYDGTTWTNDVWTLSGQQQNSSYEPWLEGNVYFDNTVTQIRFRATKDGNTGQISIDDILIEDGPSCPPPDFLTATNITDNSADLSWTANGSATAWNIEYGPAGFVQGQGTIVSATSNSYTLTGLTQATTYNFYVQSNCGGGDTSTWTGPYAFTTTGTCGNFRIDLIDSYGDGWNGGSLTVYINGTVYLSGITLNSGSGPQSYNIPVSPNDILSIVYTAGSYSNENQYIVYDNNNVQVANEGANGTPGNIGDPGIPSGLVACQTCPDPSDMSVSNTLPDSADISWTENGFATTWNIEYGPAGFTQGQGTIVQATNTPSYTLTGLSPDTSYDVYLQADCGGGDTSFWAGPYNFYTPCSIISTFPYNYGFEDNTSNPYADWTASCWSANPENLTNYVYSTGPYRWTPNEGETPYSYSTGPSSAHSGLLYAYTVAPGSNPADAKLISPIFDLSSLSSPQMSFYYHMHGADIVSLSVDTFDGSSWTNDVWMVSGQQQTSRDDPWLEATVFFSNSVTQFRFRAIRGSGYWCEIAVDDILLGEGPSCRPPTSLTTSNITGDSVDLSWTENGSATTWNIEYGPSGFTQGQGTIVQATSNPYTLTGLSPLTDYDYYIQADCGGGDTSTWIGPNSFSTVGTCGIYRVDLIDSYGDGWNGGYLTVYINGTAYLSDITLSSGYGPESHNIPVNTGDVLSFVYTPGSYSSENQYIVYDSNGVEIANEGTGNTHPNNIGDPSIPSGIVACPSCPAPSNLSASNITDASAELSWTENGSATTWNIEYGLSGFTQGQGTIFAASSNPYTLTGLLPNSEYDIYVQSDCGSGDTSAWIGPISFTTNCSTVTSLPYTEDFENNGNIPDCWKNDDTDAGGDWEFSNSNYYGMSADHTTGNGYYALINDHGIPVSDSPFNLITPTFDLSGTSYILKYWYWIGVNSAPNPIHIDVSTDGGSTWIQDVYVHDHSFTGFWLENIIDLSTFNTTSVVIRFRAESIHAYNNNSSGIDDVTIMEMPSCLPPSNIFSSDITAHSAELSWSEFGSATTWNIEYGPTGFTQGQGTTVTASSNPFTLTGLTSNTDYDYYIQSDCGNANGSDWKGPYTFTTMPACGDTFYDDGGPHGNYSANLNQTITIYPDNPGEKVIVTFNNFDMQNAWDGMMVYNGPDTNAPIFDSGSTFNHNTCPNGAWTGAPLDPYSALGQHFASTDASGALTFVFTSNGGYQFPGWEAVVSCTSCLPPTDMTVSNISNHQAELAWTENGTATSWNIEYGPSGFTPTGTPTNSGVSNPFTLTGLSSLTSYDYYVQADCGSENSFWSGPYTFKTAPGCGDTFLDDGGASGDYPPNLNQIFTIYPDNPGEVVTVTFDYLGMENGWDGMMVYNGPNTNAPIFDSGSTFNRPTCPNGAWTGTNSDPYNASGHSFISTDPSGALTFMFTSNDQNQNYGWQASVSCTSCPMPSDLTVSNLTNSQAELSWTDNGSASNWNIEYGPAGFTQGQGTLLTGISTNSYVLSGLSTGTHYDYYVQKDCGGGSTSDWVGPYSFQTLCGTISTFPYHYGFEDTTPNSGGDWSESCWSADPQNTNSGIYYGPYRWTPNDGYTSTSGTGPDGAHTGTMYAYAEASGSNSGDEAKLISPVLDLSSLSQPQLSFYYFMYGSQVGMLQVDTYDGTTWTNSVWILNGQQQTSSSDPWLLANVSIPNTVTQIRFRAERGAGYRGDIAIDDIVIQDPPTCLQPSNFSASNVTGFSAELTWTENNAATTWHIEYGPAGFTHGQGTIVTTNNNPYSLTGLNPITTYDVYVQSDCGNGDTSYWEGPVTFTTSCATISSFPYTQDFENGGNIPDCWTNDDTDAGGNWQFEDFNYNGPHEDHTTGNGYYALLDDNIPVSNNPFNLLTPVFDLSASSYIMKYWYWIGPDGAPNPIHIDISTDGGSTWTQDVYVHDHSITGVWRENVIDLSAYSSTNVMIRFRGESIDGYPIHNSGIDDVTIMETPSCLSPANITASNITAYSADLSWIEFGSATSWNIELGVTGFTPTGTPTYIGVSNPFTMSGLNPMTTYDYYVQAVCGSNNISVWEGPYTFTTSPACGDTFYDDGGPNGNYSADLNQLITIYPDNPGEVVSVVFNNFDMEDNFDGMMVYNGADTNAPVISSGSSSGQWTGGPNDEYSANGHIFTSTDSSGALTFVFTSNSASQYTGWEATVTCSTCPPPSNPVASNINASQAELSWIGNGPATTWNIELGISGFTPTGTPTYNGVSTPFTVTGLNSNTTYDYYIQSDCGGNTGLWFGPFSFTTSPACGDGFYDDGGPTGYYSNNYYQSFTVYPDNPGGVVTVTFNNFKMEEGYDSMMVYDGADTNAPIISSGSHYGRTTCPDGAWTGDPGDNYTAYMHSFTSTDPSGALTFVFTSDDTNQEDGWDAIVSCISCLDPSDLTATNFTTSQAELSWLSNGTGSEWNIEYGPTGFTQGQGTVINGVTTNPYTLTGLSSNTFYDYYVQTNCGNGNTSNWVGPYTFVTAPVCGDTFYDNGGPNGDYGRNLYQNFTIYPDNPGDVVTATFNSFNTYLGDGVLIYNGADTNAPLFDSGLQNVYGLPDGAWSGGPGDNYSADGHTFTSTDLSGALTFVFITNDIGETSGWEAVVSCGPPSGCPPPNGLTITGLSSSTVDLSWNPVINATGYNWEVVPTGNGQGNGVIASGHTTGTTATATGLSNFTTYDVYVQNDCGSTYDGPITFTTFCDTQTSLDEGFEGGVTPSCWYQDPNDDFDWTVHSGEIPSYYNTGPNAAYEGNYYLYTDSSYPVSYGDEAIIYTPPIDLSGFTQPSLNFWYHMYGAGMNPDGLIDISVSNDWGLTYTSIWMETGNHGDQWNHAIVNLPDYISQTVIFRIKGKVSSNGTTYQNDFAIDAFKIEEGSYCPAPSNLSANHFTSTSADLSWNLGGSETAWNIEYGLAGFTPGQGTLVTASYNYNFPLSGLTPATSYDFYVQADCGGGFSSSWAGPYNFSTAGTCGLLRVDLIDSYGDGWNGNTLSVYVNGTPYLTDITLTNGYGPESYFVPTNINDIVSFDYTGTGWQTENEYKVYDANGNLLADQGHGYDAPGDIGDPAIPTGLESCPTCPMPSQLKTLSIANIKAELNWRENGSASTWNIEYGPTGFTQGQGTVINNVLTNDYLLSGLSPNTAYDFYVQADCGNGDSSMWAGPFTFTTAPGCGDTFYDDGGPNGDYSMNLNEVVTIYPENPGEKVMVGFNSFDMEYLWDSMTVHDGPNRYAPIINSGYVDNFGNITCPNGAWTGDASSPYTATGHYFAATNVTGALTFVFRSNDHNQVPSSGWDADIYCATCLHPTDLSASNIRATHADLSWTDNTGATSWNIEYGPAGFTQGQGTVINGVTSPTYTLTGLSSYTDYDFYVQADCGNGDVSIWSNPYSFKTLLKCGDTFYDDGGPNGNYSAYLNMVITIYPDNPGEVISVTFNSFDMENGWDGMMVYNGPNTNYPVFDSGSYSNHNPEACPNGAWTGGPNDPYSAQGHTFTATNATGSLTFIFKSDGLYEYDGWEAVVSCTTCIPPTNLTASNITSSQAELSWTENGSATTWNIEYGHVGFTQGQGTLVTGITSNPYLLTGINSATTFDYYVQADCGGGVSSPWSGPYHFTTDIECGDTFYDEGGPNGLYPRNLNQTITLYPDNAGDVVSVTFNHFIMEYGYDGMMVYNGADTNAPIFDSGSTFGRPACPNGAWTGVTGDTYCAEGHTFTSTDSSGALTFVFTSNATEQRAGWEAAVSCGSPQTIADNQITGFNFYPNPVDHTLYLSADDNIEFVTLSNVTGQEVLHLSPNKPESQVDMSRLPNGVYFVKVRINGELTAFKIVKK